ncbi:hypothetical protein [Streptomyces corynorhini]|nr:hypothetical protein [Streptomyces corynorhini]
MTKRTPVLPKEARGAAAWGLGLCGGRDAVPTREELEQAGHGDTGDNLTAVQRVSGSAGQELYDVRERSRLTQSGRVRSQLGQLYPYTVGHSASRTVREARDSVRDLLSS